MIELNELKLRYLVNDPIEFEDRDLPKDLIDFYHLCDGIEGDLAGESSIVLYSSAQLKQRNLDYEIAEYLPELMCAEFTGDFNLGDSMQLTYRSLPPFDLAF